MFYVLSTVFQSHHSDSSNFSCFSMVSPVLCWGFDVSCPRTLLQKKQRIQCSSNLGPWITSQTLNPLADIPILGSSNSAANKDMMSKI